MTRAIVLAATLSASSCATGDGRALVDDERAELLDAHADVRATVDLEPLAWSDAAADVAAAWASRCTFQHNPDLAAQDLGENLAFFSTGLDAGPREVVEAWAAEVADYDYDANACAPGAMCGHYTQIVWATTTSVGCAKAACTIDGVAGTLWVCDYAPAGNYVGERPY